MAPTHIRKKWARIRCGAVMILIMTFAAAWLPAQSSSSDGDTKSQDQDEPVVELGPGVTPPRVTHQVSPDPNSGGQGFRINGVVLIGLIVSSRGLPKEVRVVQSLDKDLDKQAIDAVQQWRFEPARKAGNPVAVRVTVEIRFRDL